MNFLPTAMHFSLPFMMISGLICSPGKDLLLAPDYFSSPYSDVPIWNAKRHFLKHSWQWLITAVSIRVHRYGSRKGCRGLVPGKAASTTSWIWVSLTCLLPGVGHAYPLHSQTVLTEMEQQHCHPRDTVTTGCICEVNINLSTES